MFIWKRCLLFLRPLHVYGNILRPYSVQSHFLLKFKVKNCDKILERRLQFNRFNFVITVSMAEASGDTPNEEEPVKEKQQFKNRLSFEKSPYLLQHATNPVDWYPWGTEAFEKAKEDDKMIFLSVGYSTCHWCHVMERESFENEEVAKVMNENFVNIKVDREERPDVDKVYMTFVQSTTGGGGWPMSVWLTPELKPILGGTYFPPDDRYYGQPGFKTILLRIANKWQKHRDKVLEEGSRILEILTRSMCLKAFSESGKTPPDVECITSCYSQLAKPYDKTHGGFSSYPPKFPQPVNFNFLFRAYALNPQSEDGKNALEMATHTLQMMARGGIRDHLGEGFHRYSTDKFWHVPHFEKMLYDQGQLVVSYLDAYQITKNELFADVARGILQYVSRDLSDPSGGFYSAEDADSLPVHDADRKKEGAFYVWTEQEVREQLPQSIEGTDLTLADVFCRHFNVLQLGNVDPYQDPHDELKEKNVLIVRSSEEENAEVLGIDIEKYRNALAEAKKILLEVRQKRPRPHLDDKFVTSWNGLMISGFARAAQVLNESHYAERAMDAARFIHKYLYNSETGLLLRSAYKEKNGDISQITAPIPGVLEDYTFLIRALLDLYEACYDPWCVDWAHALQVMQDSLFWDTVDGGYYNSVSTDSSIVLRLKEDQDGAEPNPNSVAVTNLLRFFNFIDVPELKEKATKILCLYSHRLLKLPLALPEMICGFMFYITPITQIIVTGDKSSSEVCDLLNCIHRHFLPYKVLIVADGCSESILNQRLTAQNLSEKSDQVAAYVCRNNTCSLPVSSVHELENLLLHKDESD